ncbi:cytochrome P450 [Stereum hirsutum FP-91666 SS1]|uniref:Cytochrome P450 n=1 Tax=Stereum hirsutum (strain FP-91666) TaxID=721885 RepID=R7RXL9_STEHR|nr:cytochrome P450 [Stereum hirsutum FP-91666 SS1]EIM79122.1 cytochrome P450 [Stereum hirsutum FP-91666 SS1]
MERIAATAAASFIAFHVLRSVYRRLNGYGISDIPGPPSPSFIYGNLLQIFQEQAGTFDFKWQEQFGGVFRIRGPFGDDRLMVSDPKTLHYMFHTSGYDIIKQPERKELSRLLTGKGLIWAEGDVHRRQRKVMNPAFGPAEARAFFPIFLEHANQVGLVAKWQDIMSESPERISVFNIPNWLGRATMDAIGAAAFSYKFGMLTDGGNELAQAYNNILQETHGRASSGRILFQNASHLIPLRVIEWITDHGRAKPIARAREVTAMANRVAEDLLSLKSEALLQGKKGKDIMSLVVQANLSEDEKSRIDTDEMYSQLRTVMLAGYETTSNSLSWTLYELAKRPDIQNQLRAEIVQTQARVRARGDELMSLSDFDNMPLTTAVIKESLRMHPVAHQMYRQTSKDDVFPLSKPIISKSGKVLHEVFVPKGTRLVAAVAAYNRSKEVWGVDASEFRPERWLQSVDGGRAQGAASVGTYGNLMTFGGGVRACIGWRFAVAEMQAFAVELLRNFEFSLTEESRHIRRDVALVMIPTVEGQVGKGMQLPLRVSLAPEE